MSNAVKIIEEVRALKGSDPLSALGLLTQALECEQGLTVEEQIQIRLELCYVHRTMTNVKEGFTVATEALELSKQHKQSQDIVKAYNFLGIFCYYSGLYKRALNYFYDGLDNSYNINNDRSQVSIYTNIGETYKALNSFNQAVNYFERAYGLARSSQLKQYYTPVLCNIGDIYLKRNDLEMAEAYFKQADEYRNESVDLIYCAELDYKRALLLKRAGIPIEAFRLLEESEKQYRRLNHKFYLIDVLAELADLKSDVDTVFSEHHLMEARQIAIEISAQSKLATIAQKLSMLSEKQENYKQALEYHKSYHEYAAKSDANAILNKLEIMNLDQRQQETLGDMDVKDFANLEIFSSSDINTFIDFYHKELEYKANTDELTGLPNRRRINEQIRRLLMPEEAKVNAFFLLDIDHFKLVNDSEGHLFGDRCLMRVAKVIREWAFEFDIFAGRYGGEEFLGLAENIDELDIFQLAENLRLRIEEEQILYRLDGEERLLTVSIGCAKFASGDTHEPVKLLELADRSLYMAKSAGRNRIMFINQQVK